MTINDKRINDILESTEFLSSLKGLDDKQREIVESSAKELLSSLFNTLDGSSEKIRQRIKKDKGTVIDTSDVINERD